jgi:putative mycofactocin binding protein MftB
VTDRTSDEAPLDPNRRSALDPNQAYALDPKVALRPEPFGALAYHYGNRRLTFLRSPELVALVRDLDRHPSIDDALAASGVAPSRWPTFRRALAGLEASEVIRAR